MHIKKLFSLIIIFLCTITGCDGGGIVSQKLGKPPVTISIATGSPFSLGLAGTGTTVEGVIELQIDGGVAATNMTASTSSPFGLKGGVYPGTGGTCTATEQSSRCTIVVTYSPTVIGTDTANLVISYDINGTPYTATLQLTGYTQSVLTISDGPTYDYGIKAVGSITDKVLTVSRSAGGATATSMGAPVLTAPFSFKGGSYPGTGGTCTGTLTSSTPSCTIVVTYSPTTLAPHSGTITLFYFDGINNTSTTRPIAGTGVPPAALTVSDSGTYSFATKAVGSVTQKTYTVTYASGGVPATSLFASGISTNFVFRGGSYPGTGGTCTNALASGSCTIVVEFRPQSVATHNGTMTVSYFDGAFPQAISRDMIGIGVPPAVLSVTPTPYDYGLITTGSTADQTFTVTHVSGGVDATALNVTGLAAPYNYRGGIFPGTGGTCPVSRIVAIGTSCTIVMRYSPTVTGTYARTHGYFYNDGAFNQTFNVSVTGTTQAGLTINLANPFDFGNKVTGSSTNQTFTITHSGGVPATGMSAPALTAPYSFLTTGTYPGSGGTCGATLSSGSCTMVVNYSPVANGFTSNNIILSYNDGFGAQSVTKTVQGTGVAATVLSVSDAGTYNYGNVVTSTFATKTYTVTYVSGTLAATGIAVTGLTAPFSFVPTFPGGGTCSTTLSSGTCTFIVRYAPLAVGPNSDSWDFNYNDGAVVQLINRSVQGTGIAPATLSISDAGTHDFGNVSTSTSADKTYTVTYLSGGATATALGITGLAAPYNFKGGFYPGTGGTCGATLSSGSCTIVLSYSPVSVGPSSNIFTFSYNSGASVVNATRTMIGNTEGLLTISDAITYDYGSQTIGTTTSKTFTVTYSGGATVTGIVASALPAPFSYAGGTYPGGGTCSTTLSSGSCTIVVNYSPTAAVISNSTIQLNYNNGFNAVSASRPVTGTGLTPATLTFSPSTSFDFGTHATGEPTDATFTISHSGGSTAVAMSGAAVIAPFVWKGGTYPGTGGTCSTTLSSGSCTIVVTYTPNSVAAHSGSIGVNYNDGANNQSITRSLTGTGAAWAYLSISDGPTYNFGTQSVGSTTDKTFTVTNLGSNTATTMSGSGLANPYSFKGGSYPGAGGSCGSSLPLGAGCTIIVSYRPLSVGGSSDTIQISYNNSSSTQTSNRDITGTAAFTSLNLISLSKYIDDARLNNLSYTKTLSDINQDKAPELYQPGSVFDGLTKRPLFQILTIEKYIPKNSSISMSDDFDNDATEDMLVGNNKDTVTHHSGKNGNRFKIWSAPIGIKNFGKEVFDYYDIDGDNRREFLVLDEMENVFIYGSLPDAPMYVIPSWELHRSNK